MDKLHTASSNPEKSHSISLLCCIASGLFDNRKRTATSPVSISPVENEFVSIATPWNNEESIFNQFSRIQDLLLALAHYQPHASTREEAIQAMNHCLQTIINYSSFLLVPSLLQNSLLLFTEYEEEAMKQYSFIFFILFIDLYYIIVVLFILVI